MRSEVRLGADFSVTSLPGRISSLPIRRRSALKMSISVRRPIRNVRAPWACAPGRRPSRRDIKTKDRGSDLPAHLGNGGDEIQV